MSKTFVYDRFDIWPHDPPHRIFPTSPHATSEFDGDWVKAEDAINREAVLQAEIRTLKVQIKEAKAGASFEFDHCGITQTVRGSNEAIKALLAWRKRQETMTNNALRVGNCRSVPQWIGIKDRLPEVPGNYLAMMADENSFGYTSTEPVLVEFDAYTAHPKQFTISDSWTNGPEPANDEVTYWIPLPAAPKEPA